MDRNRAKAFEETKVEYGQLAVETVFLEATLQLVAPESSPLSDGQANAVEILVFDWVLHAEKFVDSKHSELLKARERVGFCIISFRNLFHHMILETSFLMLDMTTSVYLPGSMQ